MKKWILALIVSVILLGLVACASQPADEIQNSLTQEDWDYLNGIVRIRHVDLEKTPIIKVSGGDATMFDDNSLAEVQDEIRARKPDTGHKTVHYYILSEEPILIASGDEYILTNYKSIDELPRVVQDAATLLKTVPAENIMAITSGSGLNHFDYMLIYEQEEEVMFRGYKGDYAQPLEMTFADFENYLAAYYKYAQLEEVPWMFYFVRDHSVEEARFAAAVPTFMIPMGPAFINGVIFVLAAAIVALGVTWIVKSRRSKRKTFS